MNAHVSIVAPEALALAATNADILRAVEDAGYLIGQAAVAKRAGVPTKNIGRTLQSLQRTELVSYDRTDGAYRLTDAGRHALAVAEFAARRPAPGEAAEGASTAAHDKDFLLLAHDRMRPNPLQPRKLDLERDAAEREAMDQLKASIVANLAMGGPGVLQPVLVFPADADGVHDLSAGERRWRAVGELIAEGVWPAERPMRAVRAERSPGMVAFVGLVENGQRRHLKMIEEARAYGALIEETGWSARHAALQTGRDPRTVQEMLKVLREADPADIAAHEADPDARTWEWLRNTVKETRPADPEPAGVQGDIEDDRTEPEILINPEGAAGDRPTLPQIAAMELPMGRTITCGRAGISLTVSQQYVLCELAHKAAAQGARPDGVLQDCAYIAPDAGKDRDFAILWRNGHIAWGRALDGRYFARLSPFGRERISGPASNFPTNYVETSGYRTPWLRDVPAPAPPPSGEGDREAVEGASARTAGGLTQLIADPPPITGGATVHTPRPPRQAAGPEAELTPLQRLALLEVAHASNQPAANARGGWARAWRYWLHTTAVELANDHGLIAFSHQRQDGPHVGPHVGLTDAGRAWLHARDLQATPTQLAEAAREAGADLALSGAYVTPWLNEPPAAGDPPASTVEGTSAPAASAPQDDEFADAEAALAAVALGLDSGDDADFADLFERTGLRFPLTVNADHLCIDGADGEPLIELTGHGDLPDDLMKARLLLVAAALNALADLAAYAPPATTAPKTDVAPALPIRRSIEPGRIKSLETGAALGSIALHVRSLGFTPDAYRERWGLPRDYPLVAPNVARERDQQMKALGVDPWALRQAAEDQADEDEAQA